MRVEHRDLSADDEMTLSEQCLVHVRHQVNDSRYVGTPTEEEGGASERGRS